MEIVQEIEEMEILQEEDNNQGRGESTAAERGESTAADRGQSTATESGDRAIDTEDGNDTD